MPEASGKKGKSAGATSSRRSHKAARADEIRRAVGERIKRLRKASGKSQLELAAAAGIAANYLSDVERGQQAPTISTLAYLADALRLDLATLVDLRDDATDAELRAKILAKVEIMDRDRLALVLRFIESTRS